MAWEFNGSAWGYSEFGREGDDRPASLVGSSSLGPPMDGGFFSVDLKLGRLGKIGDGSVGKLKEPKSSSISPSPSGSSKRTRVTNGIQNILCLVEGCTADLTNSREYHRRHRVCEHHSKTPVVMVGGKEQRFCQQCSRFQSLAEFDGEKRSCRKRLDGHNRRRRKPQPEAFFMSSGSFLSIHQGTRFLQFGGSQLYTPSTTGVVPNWPGDAKHKQDQQSTFPYSAASIYKGGDKQFPFLLANDPEGCNLAVSICQQLVNTSASTERGTGNQKMPSDGLIPSANSNRALSLLSSHSEQNVIHQIQPHRAQSIGTGLQFDRLAQYPGGGEASRVHSAGWQCQHSLT